MKHHLCLLMALWITFPLSAQENLPTLVLEKVNTLRDSLGLSSLKLDTVLNDAALDHAYYIADKQKLTHFQETFSKETPNERVIYYGGQRTYVGENVARTPLEKKVKDSVDYETAANDLFTQWLKSPQHYENMVQSNYTKMGLASWISSDQKLYSTQVFSSNEIKLPKEFRNPELSWGVRPSEKTCKDDEKVYETMYFANSVFSDNNGDIYLEFHDMKFFKGVIANDNDGLAIDVVLREQLPCAKENQFHTSRVHDGEMQRPIYKYDIFRTNISQNPGKILVKIGEVPSYLKKQQWDANVIIINDNKLCDYSIPVEIPSDIYPLLELRPYFDKTEDTISTISNRKLLIQDSMHIEINYNRAKKDFFDYSEFEYYLLQTWANYVKETKVYCNASVEGPYWLNKQLLDEREMNVLELLYEVNLEESKISFESSENWSLMHAQIEQNDLTKLKGKTEAEIKHYLKSNPSSFFDSLLLDQRSTHIYAKVDTLLMVSSYADYHFASQFQNELSIHDLPWNKILRENHILIDEEIAPEVIDSLLDKKQLRTNLLGAASIGNTPRFIDSLSTEAFLADLNFDSDLQRFNFAHFLTKYWFAHYSRSYRLKGVAVTITPDYLRKFVDEIDTLEVTENNLIRLKINILLSGIHYYVAHNNWTPVNDYFNEIVALVKQGEFSPQEAFELALFCNHFHKFDQAVEILHDFHEDKTLTENGYFALAATATLIRSKLDEAIYHKYMDSAKSVNKSRYCTWLDTQFQIQRDEFLKKDFCSSCISKWH